MSGEASGRYKIKMNLCISPIDWWDQLDRNQLETLMNRVQFEELAIFSIGIRFLLLGSKENCQVIEHKLTGMKNRYRYFLKLYDYTQLADSEIDDAFETYTTMHTSLQKFSLDRSIQQFSQMLGNIDRSEDYRTLQFLSIMDPDSPIIFQLRTKSRDLFDRLSNWCVQNCVVLLKGSSFLSNDLIYEVMNKVSGIDRLTLSIGDRIITQKICNDLLFLSKLENNNKELQWYYLGLDSQANSREIESELIKAKILGYENYIREKIKKKIGSSINNTSAITSDDLDNYLPFDLYEIKSPNSIGYFLFLRSDLYSLIELRVNPWNRDPISDKECDKIKDYLKLAKKYNLDKDQYMLAERYEFILMQND